MHKLGWHTKRLGDITEYIGSGISRPFTSDNVGVPVLRSNNVSDGKVNCDDVKFWYAVDPRGADLAKVSPKEFDILVNFVNGSRKELGKAGIYLGEPKGCIVSTNFFIVRVNSKLVNPFFTNLYFQTTEYKKWLQEITGFSGPGSFNQKQIAGLRIPIPSLPEQEQIVNISECWDKAIEKTEQLICAKQKLKKGLMQQLLTGKKRFKEFKGYKWKEVKLKNLFKRITRKNNRSVTHVLTISGQYGLVDQRDYFNRSVAGKDLSGYYLLEKGEFAYNRSLMKGYPFGAIKKLDDYDEGVLSTLYLCFATNSNDADSDFFMHYFEYGLLNEQLGGIAQMGARAHGLLNVTATDFFNMLVKIPSSEEQQRIAQVLNSADKEIEFLSNKLKALKNQKKGLMQKLLTGKIRVKA